MYEREKFRSTQNVTDVSFFCSVTFQDRATPMCSYKLEDPATMLNFYRTSHAKLWKVLFKPQKDRPVEEEDISLDAATPPQEVC